MNIDFSNWTWIGAIKTKTEKCGQKTKTGKWTWADGTKWTGVQRYVIFEDDDPTRDYYLLIKNNDWTDCNDDCKWEFLCQF